MESNHFDDLSRALATSRRGALKTLAGIAAGGLLALLGRAEGDAQGRPRRPRRPRPPRPPRSGGCATRQDFDRCAQCGVCLGGRCVPDPSFCPGCRTCDAGRLMCVKVGDGETCGNCGECQGGQCVNEGDCGDCGVCEGGQCLPDNNRCAGECELCVQTGRSSTCTQAVDGSTCGTCGICRGGACSEGDCGECGECVEGTCVPRLDRCNPECEICDDESLTCDSTLTEGLLCGLDCGVCRAGTCVADTALCPDPACQTCNDETKTCDDRPDDTVCRGECSVCQGGVCVAGACQELECNACNPESGTCEPINEGGVCGGECGVCRNGACEPDQALCRTSACQFCHPDTLTCEPFPDSPDDLFICGGECGICRGGACVPEDALCAECQFCNVALACDPVFDGELCEGGTCQGGTCVEPEVCPPGLRSCGSCCYDSNPPACEACEVVLDPSSPNGFGFECVSTVPRMTERCENLGQQFDIGLGFNPAVTCGACCALPGEPCFTQTARYLCCSGGMCELDATTSAYLCP